MSEFIYSLVIDFSDYFQQLLAPQGRLIYAGPAFEATEYFAARGHTCPSSYNPADFFRMSSTFFLFVFPEFPNLIFCLKSGTGVE